VVAVAAAIVVVAVQLVSGLIGPPVVAAPASVPATHVVGSGETMWSVAGELAPQLDRRVAVDALVAANGGSERLQVGDVLEVPAALRRGA
jgi:Tfp pilus assembly protein FimV